jgi:hypothetical protein
VTLSSFYFDKDKNMNLNKEEKPKLLPIGSRVTHFSGDDSTHGKGTIIGYNGTQPNQYLKTNFMDAVKLAAEARLVDGLVNSMYDGARYPYIVRWDICQGDSPRDIEMRSKYPRGYKDVYGDECKPINNGQNIFPNTWCRIMGRMWNYQTGTWSEWLMVSEEMYKERCEEETVLKEWEFAVRPVPVDFIPRNSPADGSFVPLTRWDEDFENKTLDVGNLHSNGFLPPTGIFVEFEVVDGLNGPVMRKGVTADLGAMGPSLRHETVFVSGKPWDTTTWPTGRVARWRELVDPSEITAEMWLYITKELRPK